MNNIYKVIWSKAKNCYVVASEIARSHTKSASGSEKIGGVTRRSLLASLMALSLLCGGLGVASAADSTVHVDASTTPSNATEVYTTTGVNTLLADYGKKEDVQNNKNNIANLQTTTIAQGQKITENTTNIANNKEAIDKKIDKETADATYATKEALNNLTTTVNGKADLTALEGKADKTYVDQKFTEAGTSVETKLGDYYNKADVDGKITAEENARNTAINTAITQERNDRTTAIDTAINGEVAARTQAINTAITQEVTARDLAVANAKTYLQHNITAEETARKEADTAFNTRLTTAEGKIGANETAIGDLKAADTALEGEITKNREDIATLNGKVATAEGNITDLKAKDTDLEKKIQTNADNIQTNSKAIADTNKRTGGIARNDAENKTIIEKSVTVDSKGNVTADGKLKAGSVDAGDGAITTTGAVNAGSLNVTNGATSLKETTVNGKLTAKENATFEKNVTVEKDLTVDGKLNVGEIYMKNDTHESTGKTHDSATAITADGISNRAKVTDENGNTTESKFTHNEKGTFNYAKDKKITGEWKGATSNVTADGVFNKMTDSDGNTHTYYQTATESKEQLVNGDKSKSNFEKKTAEGNTISITEKDADGNLKSSLTNTQTVNGEKTSVTNEDSSSTINQGADQIRYNVTSKDENKTSSSIEVKADGITNTSKDGTITNDAKDIENNATGDITNTAQNGSIINKAENGNISNTAQNVTNEGTESVTNKVGKNEVKVSKDGVNIKAEDGKKITESVGTASRVVENDKITDEAGNSTVTTENGKGTTFGKEGIADTTNIYGDSIKTGTINARDTTTGKLTAGAAADVDGGRLTVDANDGVKGSYKYGDYTSRSYILANTLQSGVDNGKDITDNGFVGSRTDHYMDGDKAKLNETVKDADGSNVTKKTSTKTYTEIKDTNGNTLSVNQKADGNNYKLEDQDGNTNHVTNSATQSKQTLKDKDGNTLTTNQTATKNNFDLKSADGSKENHTTNTVDESRVAIKGENGKAELSTTDEGTTFKHSAAKEAFTEGGATNTTIKGNTITTGKVTMDYADVMKDLGVKGNTTLGEAGKDTTLTVNSKATFNNGLTVTNGETKLKNTTIEGTLNVSENATFQKDVTANSFSVNGKTYIDSDGLNANNQVIRNVADGSISEGSKDAVNGGQLYTVKNDLEGKVNKVGANAAAMANLHPMEFDPASKWNIAAAIGNYGSETAAALGAFYRPNDDVMVNLSTAFGTGENMVGGGVSVRLGKGGNKLSREETNALKAQVADLSARMDALLSVLNPNMLKDFPDVPENHWAYEAVSRLAGNDIVQGYPDGEFHGERTMTRYEMAEIIYNALSRGAEAEKELVEEFKPELQAMAASEKATAERAEG